MKIFVSYKVKKETNNPYYTSRYKKGHYILEMCKTCGYPMGEHYGRDPINTCPLPENDNPLPRTLGLKPIWYEDKLNVNTKVI